MTFCGSITISAAKTAMVAIATSTWHRALLKPENEFFGERILKKEEGRGVSWLRLRLRRYPQSLSHCIYALVIN